MYLNTKRAKGKKYIYLYCYSKKEKNPKKREKKVYSFGRNDIALERFKRWRKDFSLFPEELKMLGCTQKDLIDWIVTVETGITKTGKQFKAAI
jgi:hypothetical protein